MIPSPHGHSSLTCLHVVLGFCKNVGEDARSESCSQPMGRSRDPAGGSMMGGRIWDNSVARGKYTWVNEQEARKDMPIGRCGDLRDEGAFMHACMENPTRPHAKRFCRIQIPQSISSEFYRDAYRTFW